MKEKIELQVLKINKREILVVYTEGITNNLGDLFSELRKAVGKKVRMFFTTYKIEIK